MAPNKIIIDTDPVSCVGRWGTYLDIRLINQGVDDILAMMLAFAANPEELEILMISLTFGNVEVQKYVIIFFHILRRNAPLL
jgi:inosine-uridine nucleoside N-ribohydrolase